MLLHAIFLYATLAMCAVGIGAAVRRYDLVPREPWYSILTALVVGAALMWIAGRVQVQISQRIYARSGEFPSNVMFAFLAASTEETAKLATVWVIALAFRKVFNETSDGVVYGAFAGLGAAILESVYVVDVPMGFQLLPLEEPVRLAGHIIMGAISGAGVGPFGVKRSAWMVFTPISFFLGFLLHFLWDILAFETADFVQAHGKTMWSQNIAAMGLMITGMLMFRLIAWRAGVRLHARDYP
jgi:RsiW-degrading membrane proteinase PrsW (M82 family)